MKHILMIATGGTIASKETADGLTPQLTSEELLAEVPELEQLCRIDTRAAHEPRQHEHQQPRLAANGGLRARAL